MRGISEYPTLFSPLKIRNITLPNRTMSTAAVFRLATEDGHITPEITERYQRMAKGGLGAIVVEAAVVLPSRSSFNLRVSDDAFIPELADFVAALRSVNAEVRIGLQIMHFLKLSRSGWRQRVEDLKREEVEAIPEMFASGAVRTKLAGFDFVEVHMAHFTTLASFLSLSNKREDEFGGDFQGRMELPTRVIEAVRAAVGDFAVGARINGEDFTREGNTLLHSARIAPWLAQAGVDYINVSAGERFEDAAPPPEGFPPFAGTGYSGARMCPRWWNPDGVHAFLAEGVRAALRNAGHDIPVVTAGKIRTPDVAEKILADGKADIIGMARTILADPDWPEKAREGRADEIVKCAACGFCCESDERYEIVTCLQWPKGAVNAPEPWLLAPPCQVACPAGVDVRTYIDLIGQGLYEQALEVIEEKVALPGVVGRVCPRFCETKCNRSNFDGAVAICALKRHVADTVAARGNLRVTAAPRIYDERVAIVGSGPAGLAAGAWLARLGYGVTIFEAESLPGGMLAWGIPEYRLPREVLNAEIARIQDLGVEIRLGSRVGDTGLSLTDLKAQGFAAVFLAVGAQAALSLDIPGARSDQVVNGATWLKAVNLGQAVQTGARVAVVGGGNVAIDAARTAKRLGAESVSILYRRSVEEMPAISSEVAEAEREGIKLQYFAAPQRVLADDGVCVGLECVKTSLGEPDASGRRRPVVVAGSEFVVEADLIIVAVGQTPDLSFLADQGAKLNADGTIWVDAATSATSIPGLFAAGDVVTGPATVVEALAAGRRAAMAMDSYLRGSKLQAFSSPAAIPFEDVDLDFFKPHARAEMPTIPVAERAGNAAEVEMGLDAKAAANEVVRCFQCGMFPKK